MREGPIKFVLLLVLSMCVWHANVYGQDDRIKQIETKLQNLANTAMPGLNQQITVSVSDVSLTEFLRGIAISNNFNVSVDPAVSKSITVNFFNESIINILVFLVRQYGIDITFTGSIIYVTNYMPPPVETAPRQINISYNRNGDLLSLDLRSDTLYNVVKEITRLSGRNVVVSPDIRYKPVTAYFENLGFKSALDKLAISNQFALGYTADSMFLLTTADPEERRRAEQAKEAQQQMAEEEKTAIPQIGREFKMDIAYNALGEAQITLRALDAPTKDLIKLLANELNLNYIIFDEPSGQVTLDVESISFDEFLAYALQATEFDYKREQEIYMIGQRVKEGFTTSTLIELQFRSIDIVMENIPSELKKGVEVRKFEELNSLIVSGPAIKVYQIERFVRQIDKVVPVIMIEVLIVDVNSTKSVRTGIEAGLASEPVQTQGKLFPDVDVTISSGSVNEVLDIISRTGIVNLGKVTPNFYVSLRMLEEQGYLKLRSTPRLSTLNGHEATMNIGNTDYYLEETNNIIGVENPQTIITKQYKPIQADFTVTINPIVSGEEEVTMSISVQQSTFTTRIAPDAPPGSTSRNFQSLIRVKNEEMIVLGGLEEREVQESGSGFPILSRIPIIKWFFSSRDRSKRKSKLNIFIKPTIIY